MSLLRSSFGATLVVLAAFQLAGCASQQFSLGGFGSSSPEPAPAPTATAVFTRIREPPPGT